MDQYVPPPSPLKTMIFFHFFIASLNNVRLHMLAMEYRFGGGRVNAAFFLSQHSVFPLVALIECVILRG